MRVIKILFIVGFLLITSSVNASTEVFFSNPPQNILQRDTFTIDLKVSSSKDSINVVDGVVVFDKNILEVKKVTTDNSILSTWPKEASFDNDKGEIGFTGGVGGGFVGENGQILQITFLAKKEGKIKLDFKDSFTVYLNDGKGTSFGPWLKPIEFNVLPKTQNNFQLIWILVPLTLFVFVVLFIVKKYVTFK